jgi:hypothetical protein
MISKLKNDANAGFAFNIFLTLIKERPALNAEFKKIASHL